jgi:glycerol uptake facilitator-like aquaporin
LQQNLTRIVCGLTSNQKKFIVEVIGTFIVVVLATGSVVIDATTNGALGVPFIAFAPFVGVALGVYLFWENFDGSFQSCCYNWIFGYKAYW